MNKFINKTIAILLLFLIPCYAGNHKKKYVFPETFTKEQCAEMLEKCEKGEALFKEQCSSCHGIFTGGKDSIPNFTEKQIDNYSAKFLRHDPKNHAVSSNMSPDQLNETLMFLRYRKIDTTKK